MCMPVYIKKKKKKMSSGPQNCPPRNNYVIKYGSNIKAQFPNPKRPSDF